MALSEFKQKNNYSDYPKACDLCKYSINTNSVMTGIKCTLADEEVSPEGCCDKFVDANPVINS
jgi:hypothetical protein